MLDTNFNTYVLAKLLNEYQNCTDQNVANKEMVQDPVEHFHR